MQLNDIYVGAVFTVFSRKLKVVDFADDFTRSRFDTREKYEIFNLFWICQKY